MNMFVRLLLNTNSIANYVYEIYWACFLVMFKIVSLLTFTSNLQSWEFLVVSSQGLPDAVLVNQVKEKWTYKALGTKFISCLFYWWWVSSKWLFQLGVQNNFAVGFGEFMCSASAGLHNISVCFSAKISRKPVYEKKVQYIIESDIQIVVSSQKLLWRNVYRRSLYWKFFC